MRRMRMICLLILTFVSSGAFGARSIFRPQETNVPRMTTRWQGATKTYQFSDSHLEEHALFEKFEHDYFMSHLLPRTAISYRNEPERSVTGDSLSEKIENFILELYARKKEYTDFQILKDQDYNKKSVSGNLVCKFKEYPFVLKLFIESPESFVKPYSKGWQPACFFLMSGGINRYLSGFTRIKNLDVIKGLVKDYPEWGPIIDFPRKWFWMPQNISWFELSSNHIGTQDRTVLLPAIYAIVADAIEEDKKSDLLKKDPQLGLKLSYYVDNRLDPHYENFMVEKGTGKVVIVDTEHFPSMVGLREKVNYTSYVHWYMRLAGKCLIDQFGRTKKCRKELQTHPSRTLPIALAA